MSELLEDLEIPGMDDVPPPAPKHGFELDPLRWPSGNPWYVYLRDPSLHREANARAKCVGTVTISTGPKAWQWWVDGYQYKDPRARGHADEIEEAAEQAWAAWQSAPERAAVLAPQPKRRGSR